MSNNAEKFDWSRGFTVDYDFQTGFSKTAESTKRYLSQMKDMYSDVEAAEKTLETKDPLVYEFYEMGAPETSGDIAFGTSITYPGKVGNEYFMTKGHFHTILNTAEVYFTLQGKGLMLMENMDGDVVVKELTPGHVLYVPKGYAHRTINVGDTPFVSFFCFRADAGHDYGTIETKGYRKLIVDNNGVPDVVDNPKWK